MAEVQALTVDEKLQCLTSDEIFNTERPASEACQMNHETKDVDG